MTKFLKLLSAHSIISVMVANGRSSVSIPGVDTSDMVYGRQFSLILLG